MNGIKIYVRIALIVIATTPFAMADENLPSDTHRYNEAVQWYAAGETTRAAEAFEQLSGSDRDEIAARSRYNLGNDRYAEALKLLEQEGSDPVTAVGLLQDAVKHYRSALEIDSADQDARANIELAMTLISEIQQQQNEQKTPEQPQSEQPQSDQQKEQEEQQQDPQQQTESDSEQSESKKDPSPSNDSDPRDESKTEKTEGQQSKDAGQGGESEANSEAQPNQDQNQDSAENNPSQSDANEGQSETSESADNDQGESADSQSMQPDPDPAPSPENPNSNQSSASPADDNGDADPSDASEQPANAAESDPSKTEGELSAVNGQNENEAADQDDSRKPTAVGVMTEDEANKMLQAIRDREMLRRMQTEREQRRRQVPVDKDW